MTLFCVLGQTNSFGVFQELYTRSHTASASKNSWIGSFQLFLTVATGLPAGKLLDMGYFKPVFLAGSVLYVFSCVMSSVPRSDRLPLLNTTVVVSCSPLSISTGIIRCFSAKALGWGSEADCSICLPLPSKLIIGRIIGLLRLVSSSRVCPVHQHIRKIVCSMLKRSCTMLRASGAAAGGIAFPIMLNRLFYGSVGFAWGVRASAFLILGLLSIANLVMSPGNTAPNKVSPATPPHQGMQRILRDMPYVLVVLG